METIRINLPFIFQILSVSTSFPLRFCLFSCLLLSNFASDPLIWSVFIFKVQTSYCYSVSTCTVHLLFDCFTLLVTIPKNKIRSIINSFIINTVWPRLLIFLYCSPGTFSHRFKTLLFLLLWPENEYKQRVTFIDFLPDYPAFLVYWRQGYVLFKRTIITFIESDSTGLII